MSEKRRKIQKKVVSSVRRLFVSANDECRGPLVLQTPLMIDSELLPLSHYNQYCMLILRYLLGRDAVDEDVCGVLGFVLKVEELRLNVENGVPGEELRKLGGLLIFFLIE